jgi:hypothetical protein
MAHGRGGKEEIRPCCRMIGIGRGDGDIDRKVREDRSFSLSLQVIVSWERAVNIISAPNLLPCSRCYIPFSGLPSFHLKYPLYQSERLVLVNCKTDIKRHGPTMPIMRPDPGSRIRVSSGFVEA